jgi:hypothetical protein
MKNAIPLKKLNTHIGVDDVTSVNVKGVNNDKHVANVAVMIVIIIIGNVNKAMICTGSTILLRCLMIFNLRGLIIDMLRG